MARRVSDGEFTWNDVLLGTVDMRDEPALRAAHEALNRQAGLVREVVDLGQRGVPLDRAATEVLTRSGGPAR